MTKEDIQERHVRLTVNSGIFNKSIIKLDCPFNCKLTYLNGIDGFLGFNLDSNKEDFEAVLKECRIATYINTRLGSTKDFILKNFEVYSLSKIPIGYSGTYQYHIIIRNTIGVANNNMRPSEYKEEPKELTATLKEVVVDKKVDILDKIKTESKKNKKRTDFIKAIEKIL